MAPKVILITRDDITRNNDLSFISTDKRIILITFLYSIVSNNYENIRLKKISGNQITYEEMKEAFTEMKENVSYTSSDLLYFIDEKSIFATTTDYASSLQTELTSLFQNNDIDIFYLSNSMDNCNSIEKIYQNEYPYIYYKSKSPKGLFGVVSTFDKWLPILNFMKLRTEQNAMARLTAIINVKSIVAASSWPRILVPNIFTFEVDSVDNLYLAPCRLEDNFNKNYIKKESLSFYWFCLGVILFITIFWLRNKLYEKN